MATSKAARELHDEVIQLGAGEIFIDVYESGAPTGGERYLGDSPGATITITTERTTIQSNDGAVSRDLIDRVRSVSRVMGFTVQDASLANWALFIVGELEDATTIAAVAADGAVGVATGLIPGKRWAPILNAANGVEVGAITLKKAAGGDIDATAVVKGTDAAAEPATAAAAGTDYEFDEKTGRIFNLLATKTRFKVVKGQTAGRKVTRAKATAAASETICALRYVEDEVEGVPGRNVHVLRTNIVPSGEAALKSSDTPQQFAFTATAVDPGGGRPVMTIDGVEK